MPQEPVTQPDDINLDDPGQQQPQPAPQPQEPLPQRPQHSPRHVRMARDFGLSDSFIDSLSPAELEEEIFSQARAANLIAQRESHISGIQQGVAGRNQPTPPPQPQEPDFDWGTTEDGRPLTENDHATWTKNLVRQHKELQKELREIKKKTGEHDERFEQSNRRNRHEMLDTAFDQLPDHFTAVFGEGGAADLKPGGDEMRRRVMVISAAGITDDDGPAAVRRKIRMAAEAGFGSFVRQKSAEPADPYADARNLAPVQEPEPDRRTSGQRRWDDAALAKPTQRKSPAMPKGIEKAKAVFQEGMKNLNGEGGGQSSEQEELPD